MKQAYYCAPCKNRKSNPKEALILAKRLKCKLWMPSNEIKSYFFEFEGALECQKAIDKSEIVICQPPIGRDCAWELGYAVAKNKPIYVIGKLDKDDWMTKLGIKYVYMSKIPTIISDKIESLYTVDKDNNTFIKQHLDKDGDEFIVRVGDDKQLDFKPRVKIERWHNEINFSVGLIENGETPEIKTEEEKIKWIESKREVHFYQIKKSENKVKPTQLRYINLRQLTPAEFGAEYELFRNSDTPTITTFSCDKEAIVLYGRYPADKYFGNQNLSLPVGRLATHGNANPMFVDQNLVWFDLHWDRFKHDIVDFYIPIFSAISEVLKPYGVDVIRDGLKLYYEKDGKKVKFCTLVVSAKHVHFYLNFGTNYHKVFDYYKDGIERIKHDEFAGGLWDLNQNISFSIIDEIVKKIAQNLETNLIFDDLNQNEIKELNTKKSIHLTKEWIENCERNDIDWDELNDRCEEGYEFEIILKEKPITNKIELSIQTKKLDFFYQPKLSKEEKYYSIKPENIEGSYAVYHKTKVGNFLALGGENYRAGKAFSIYRPLIIDAVGNKIWGELNINIEKEILTVIILQDFLDKAVYPIRHVAGLTFGFTPGNTPGTRDSFPQRGSVFTMGTDAGTGTNMSAYDDDAYGLAHNIKCAIYLHSTSGLVANGGTPATNVAGAAGWKNTSNFATAPSLSASIDYVLMFSSGATYPGFYYDAGSTNQGHTNTTTYANFPASSETFGHNDRKYGIYATYTATASSPKRRIFPGIIR